MRDLEALQYAAGRAEAFYRDLAICREGTAWFGGTSWRGIRAMRISVCNFRTTREDVDQTVAAVARVLEAVA